MDIVRFFKRLFLALLWPVVLMAVTFYFGWYGLNGAHGQKALPGREAALAAAKADLAAATAERDDWSRKVDAMQSDHMDPDMLDEQARSVLGLAQPNEIVVPYPKGKTLQ